MIPPGAGRRYSIPHLGLHGGLLLIENLDFLCALCHLRLERFYFLDERFEVQAGFMSLAATSSATANGGRRRGDSRVESVMSAGDKMSGTSTLQEPEAWHSTLGGLQGSDEKTAKGKAEGRKVLLKNYGG